MESLDFSGCKSRSLVVAEPVLIQAPFRHDNGGMGAFRRGAVMFTLCILTILAGAFICVAGTYVTIKLIIDAYNNGIVGAPFSC